MASEASLIHLAHGTESALAAALIITVNKGTVKVQ